MYEQDFFLSFLFFLFFFFFFFLGGGGEGGGMSSLDAVHCVFWWETWNNVTN